MPHFGPDYHEEVALSDGTRIVLRRVRPDDKALLERGFDRFSETSRFRRFFSTKERLTEHDLAYLTEVDGDAHFALGAVREDELGRETGLGIARFVRLPDRPDVAEPAVAVADDMHRRGLGRLLCRRLAEAAIERGVAAFRCEVLVSNDPMRGLLESLAPNAAVTVDKDIAVIEFPLVDADAPPSRRPEPRLNVIEQLLALAGQGLLRLRRALADRG